MKRALIYHVPAIELGTVGNDDAVPEMLDVDASIISSTVTRPPSASPYAVTDADALTYSLLAFATTILAVGLVGGLLEAWRLMRGQH